VREPAASSGPQTVLPRGSRSSARVRIARECRGIGATRHLRGVAGIGARASREQRTADRAPTREQAIGASPDCERVQRHRRDPPLARSGRYRCASHPRAADRRPCSHALEESAGARSTAAGTSNRPLITIARRGQGTNSGHIAGHILSRNNAKRQQVDGPTSRDAEKSSYASEWGAKTRNEDCKERNSSPKKHNQTTQNPHTGMNEITHVAEKKSRREEQRSKRR